MSSLAVSREARDSTNQGDGMKEGFNRFNWGKWFLTVVVVLAISFPATGQTPPDEGPGTPPPTGVIDRDGGEAPTFAPQGRKPTPGREPAADSGTAAETAPEGKPQEGPPEKTVKVEPPDSNIKVDPAVDPNIPCQALPLNAQVRLNFKDVPIDDLIKMMSCWTQKNFMLTQNYQGKTVTLLSPEPVTVAEAYKAFISALRIHGLIIVQSGAYYRIIPDSQGKQEPLPLYKESSGVPDDEQMVTKIVKLKYVPASELSQVLNGFKGKTGEIIAYGEDTLIITDSAIMVRQLLVFIKELDRPTDKEKIWVRPVQYAEAGELVEIITSVFGEDAAGGRTARATPAPTRGRTRNTNKAKAEPTAPGAVSKENEEAIKVTKVMADERTNQLIIVCNSSTYMAVDKLIRKVDVPIPGEGGIHIYYLENADAEELASTLSTLASSTSGRSSTPRGGKAGTAGKGGAGGVAGLFEGEVKITAHKQTNSLIVEASLKDFNSLKRVVQKLDIRRRQVYVEAIIMEISSNRQRKFGISGSGGTTFEADGETVPLLMGLGGMGISGLDMSQLTKGGIAMGLQGPLVDVSTGSSGTDVLTGDLSIPTYGFLLQAIASNSDVNILSTPHILTTDNEEAEIQVGKQIPYRATSMGGLGGLSSLAGLGGLTSGSTSSSLLSGLGGYSSMLGSMGMGMGMVQRIDVDLTLKITPHVNESNYVRLEIEQSIEDVESIDRELGPTTSKRKVTNTVVVKDQQPVVIGGLIRDTESEGVDKIPFLGDIPLVGVFFRKTVTTTEKKNLLMIIIPHIIDDPSDLERIHRERMEEIRRFADYLATKEKEKKGIVDYQKKHGGLEAMNQVVTRARETREGRERAEFEGTTVDMVGPPETHDLDYDPTRPEKQP